MKIIDYFLFALIQIAIIFTFLDLEILEFFIVGIYHWIVFFLCFFQFSFLMLQAFQQFIGFIREFFENHQNLLYLSVMEMISTLGLAFWFCGYYLLLGFLILITFLTYNLYLYLFINIILFLLLFLIIILHKLFLI